MRVSRRWGRRLSPFPLVTTRFTHFIPFLNKYGHSFYPYEVAQPLSSREESLLEILEKALPLPPKIIVGYNKLERDFTSGDLSRACDISRSSAKFYVNKMVDLRLATKVPHKRMYQKFANANKFSDWLKDLMKLALDPLENGDLEPIDETEDDE